MSFENQSKRDSADIRDLLKTLAKAVEMLASTAGNSEAERLTHKVARNA